MKGAFGGLASSKSLRLLRYLPAFQSQRILFDHLPKCGGTTLNTYLDANYPSSKIFTTDTERWYPGELTKRFKDLPRRVRYSYGLVKGHFANELIDFVHPASIKVTVLRDPIERLISHYFYVKRTPSHYLYSVLHDQGISLEDYAGSDLSDELQNWYTAHFSGLPINEVNANPSESISKAVETLKDCYDIIGFLESFSQFMHVLRARANLRQEYRNDLCNVTSNRPKLLDISRSAIVKLEKSLCLDIEFYRRSKEYFVSDS